MHVRSLRLAGFKSFADPTLLDFEPGVNVIVGPNGSGKSNIADALAWVLGAQAPSSLRGGSMEDVIFAGSDGRPRLGIAEVELVLDNSSRILPLDLNEVTIARSTDRTGASEYSINGAPCRLLDIAELLSDTGIGRSIHAVVGQGQLDEILHARPEDRRVFIEEAAQIGKYRRRKERSLRKIERVDDNMVRLNDVLLELRRAVRPLKRQAKAASQYSELLGEQTAARQRLAATEVARLEAEAQRWDPDAEAHRAALLSEELATVRARLEGAGAERASLTEAADRTRATAHRMSRAVDRLAGLSRLAEERAERIAARLAAETEEGYRERIRLLEAERARGLDDVATLGEAAERAGAAAKEADEAARRESSAHENGERRLARARNDETAAAQALVRAEGSEAAGRATLGSIEARAQSVEERREVTRHELEKDAASIEAAEREIRTLEAELDAATEAAAAAETRLEQEREQADELKARLWGTGSLRAAAEARLAALEEVSDLLADHPEVGARIAPLIEDARDRLRVTEEAEEEARGVLAGADASVERHWTDVAKYDEELRSLDALMAGAAERLAGKRRRRDAREVELAALSDELARAKEAVAAAQRAAAEERATLPERRASLNEAGRIREEAETEVGVLRARAASASAVATEAHIEARSAEERALASRRRLEEAETGIADAEAALSDLEHLRTRLVAARDRARGAAAIAHLAAERGVAWVARAEEREEVARRDSAEGERRLNALRSRERDLAERLEQVSTRRSQAEVHRAESRTRIEAVAERAMDDWGMGLEDLRLLEPLEADAEIEAREQAERLERQLRRLGPVNPRAAEEYSELAERETFLMGQIDDLKASKRDLMKVVRDVDETMIRVFEQSFQDVAREFETVFERLFPGGRGSLKLTDPDDVLSSGIEVEARPPGKNIRKLSLLSGGERSLVALAFLFAIFRARPSPFYLLDEVEAALDDVNLQRFLTLIAELETRAQVLVVTHQKRTMEAADVLYGVTMAQDGVSRVVVKRMEELESV